MHQLYTPCMHVYARSQYKASGTLITTRVWCTGTARQHHVFSACNLRYAYMYFTYIYHMQCNILEVALRELCSL